MTIPSFQIPNFASPVILGQPESLMDRLLRLRKAALDQNLAGLNTPAAGPPPNFGQRLVQNLKDYLLTGPDLNFSAPETRREPFAAGLISGGLQAYGGVQAGQMGRQRMEQQRADQAFKDRLTAALQIAQIGHLNAQSDALQHPRPGTPHYFVDDQGNVTVSTENAPTSAVPVAGARGKRTPVPDGGLVEQKAMVGARTAIESIDDAERLYARGNEIDALPFGTALARGAKTSGGLLGFVGGAAEPLAQQAMSPDQQQFQADMQRMVHSMVGLLPGSRQSVVLFNSLVNAYTPLPGESPQARGAKRAARQRARTWLAAVEQGKNAPIPPELAAAGITPADLPGPAPRRGLTDAQANAAINGPARPAPKKLPVEDYFH